MGTFEKNLVKGLDPSSFAEYDDIFMEIENMMKEFERRLLRI